MKEEVFTLRKDNALLVEIVKENIQMDAIFQNQDLLQLVNFYNIIFYLYKGDKYLTPG